MTDVPQTALAGKAHVGNRWLVAIMGTLLQVGLGTVYAWSFFQNPMKGHFGLQTDSPVAWIFCLAICSLGLAAAVGGILMSQLGPRKLALSGALLYPIGWLLGSYGLSVMSLPWVYVGFGLVGGVGLGLGYVTPVATAAKWFPDKKGLVTGMVLMGFGFGALLMSKVLGPFLMGACRNDLVSVFRYAGGGIALICVPAALFMRLPPAGYRPPNFVPCAAAHAAAAMQLGLTPGPCLASRRFAMMWVVFFCNITAGIMFISFQSPMLQDLLKRAGSALDADGLKAAGGTLIAVSSIFNGLGRMAWGGVADRLGRVQALRLILGSQVLIFVALIFVPNPWVFGVLVCYILLCYGGGFGTMPAYVLDSFGVQVMPVVYGTILTAWSMGGIVGPQLVAMIKDHVEKTAQGSWTFGAGAALLALGLAVSLLLDNAPFHRKAVTGEPRR